VSPSQTGQGLDEYNRGWRRGGGERKGSGRDDKEGIGVGGTNSLIDRSREEPPSQQGGRRLEGKGVLNHQCNSLVHPNKKPVMLFKDYPKRQSKSLRPLHLQPQPAVMASPLLSLVFSVEYGSFVCFLGGVR